MVREVDNPQLLLGKRFCRERVRRAAFLAGIDSSLARHVARLFLLALLSIFVLAGLRPCHALAATWPVPSSELSASVGFHETYTAGDRSYAHSGIDIPASAGMQISTPAAGTVSFTGAVPSGDSRIGGASSQETMRAVSIKMASGKTVTLMPFASVDVKRGQAVAEGEALGTLASSGDISSSGPHLHMGLKKGRVYYDPMSLFGMSSAVVSGAAREQRGEQGSSTGADARESAEVEAQARTENATAAEPVAEPASVPEAQPEAENPKARSRESAEEGAAVKDWVPGEVSSGNVAWQPGVQGEQGPSVVIGAVLEPVAQACARQASALVSGLRSLSQNAGIPEAVVYLAALAGALAALVACMWVVSRWVVPVIGSLWRSKNSSWPERRKSVKLLGLFPAPGSAFIPRGR